MNWTVIISAILAKFGPILVALIQSWLEGLLKESAASMGPAEFYLPHDRNAAILSQAILLHDEDGDRLWVWQRLPWSRHARRRRLLAKMLEKADRPLSIMDESELRIMAREAA